MRSKTFLTAVAVVLGLTLFMPEILKPSRGAPAQGSAERDPLKRTTPAWFDEAKLGIFIHWNAASIPAFASVTTAEARRAESERNPNSNPVAREGKRANSEIYGSSMLVPDSAAARHHARHYGDMPYEEFVRQFRDEMIPGWDPEAWADLFARAGARYIVLTTRQDDGFLLWPSAHPNPHRKGWQSKRDVVGELAAAVRARGLRFGTYYSGGVDWTFSGLPMNSAVPLSPEKVSTIRGFRRNTSQAQRDYVNAHWRELVERYRTDIMWNDYFYPGASIPQSITGEAAGELPPGFKEHVEELFRFYLERVPDGVINNRFDIALQSGGQLYTDFVTPENTTNPEGGVGRPEGSELKWEVCRPIGTSFGFNRQESNDDYMSATELIHMFVDIVARGGNLLINVGPMGTGEIAWPQAQRLLQLGWWLRTNGNAIYGTRPWVRAGGIAGEGQEVRYTANHDSVFAILLGAPRTPVVELDLRLEEGVKVELEGRSGSLKWEPTLAGVRVESPVWPDERPALSLRFSPATGVAPF